MCSNPERPLSPALQRQVALLKQDGEADYFFFDEQDRPIRLVMSSQDHMMRQNFYHLQEECMFGGLNGESEAAVMVSVEAMVRNSGEG
jgi:hypothetical protein